MENTIDTTISAPAVKVVTSIASAAGAQVLDTPPGVFDHLLELTWPNLAAAAACFYSLALLGEFWWKKFWRPCFVRRGWIKPRAQHSGRHGGGGNE
jgi:hypothetical protein